MTNALWIWGIIGSVLLGAEMLLGTFYLIWFGIAAMSVAIALWIFPTLTLSAQLFCFAVLSIGSLTMWMKYRVLTPSLSIGQSNSEAIGKVGLVTEAVGAMQHGKITFNLSVMGSREWVAIADQPIEAGNQAVVTAIEGNYLRISKQP